MSWCRKMMGCLSFQIVIIRKNWGNGQMLKRFKGGAENRSGGPEKVRWKEGGEQEILGGIIALRRIVRGEHQKARSLNLSKQWYVFCTGTNFMNYYLPLSQVQQTLQRRLCQSRRGLFLVQNHRQQLGVLQPKRWSEENLNFSMADIWNSRRPRVKENNNTEIFQLQLSQS